MPKAKPASSAPSKTKKPTKTAVPAVSDDIDGEIARQAEDRAELAAKILNAPFPRPANDPFPIAPATAIKGFPSYFAEPTMSREEVLERMRGLELPTDSPPISKPSAPFPTESDEQGTNTGRIGDESNDGNAGQDASFPTPFPTDTHSSGQTEQNAGDGQEAEASATPLTTAGDPEKNTGGVAFFVADSRDIYQNGVVTRVESQAEATRRWRLEGIGERVAAFRDRVRDEYKVANPGCKRRDAHEHAWSRAMAAFPPAGVIPEPIPEVLLNFGTTEPDPPSVAVAPAPIQDDQGVSGLSELPPGWPELPANAQLQVEIAWVTANRLRVRDGTGVNLSKALSPAPSYSALSWLETSILFPAKFADISVKATASQDDEKEFVKREKLAIAEIRSILAEMLEAKD